jgi:hypothetical protein
MAAPEGDRQERGSSGSTPSSLQNRLVLATVTWRDLVDEPLPKLPPGEPVGQVEAFELLLVERVCRDATAATSREVAERTWDLVHDRADDDPVKRRVIACHAELAKLLHEGARGEEASR